jgi:hypothetical protein
MRMYSEIAKTANVQIIRPTLGVINHDDELVAGVLRMMAGACIGL